MCTLIVGWQISVLFTTCTEWSGFSNFEYMPMISQIESSNEWHNNIVETCTYWTTLVITVLIEQSS